MEWTGLEFANSQRAVKNREKWRKMVAKSSVVPQRPSRLRDRFDERETPDYSPPPPPPLTRENYSHARLTPGTFCRLIEQER